LEFPQADTKYSAMPTIMRYCSQQIMNPHSSDAVLRAKLLVPGLRILWRWK